MMYRRSDPAFVLALLAGLLTVACGYRAVMGVSKREHGRICSQPVECVIQPAEGVVLSPLDECQIALLKQRCTVNDRCLISCWSAGGTIVGGGCYHWCTSVRASSSNPDVTCLWLPPAGWRECRQSAPCLPPDCSAFEYYSSDLGGYAILLPTQWALEESRTSNEYAARLAPPVDPGGAIEAFDVLRLRDFRQRLRFRSDHPRAMAKEQAEQLGTDLAGGGEYRAYELSPGDLGEPIHYRIVAGSNPSGCPIRHLVVAVHRKRWFSAWWTVRCDVNQGQNSEADVYAMIGSLFVDPEWQ